jgi:competence ComEA-like helix-hairpin-helix protein
MKRSWVIVAALLAALAGGVDAADKLNLNAATKEQLMGLGLTESQALQVIAHREKTGPFLQVEELLAVQQMNKATFEKVRDHVTVDE